MAKNTSDRYPSKPIIESTYPRNLTVVENSTAVFECPVLGDLGVHIQWERARYQDDAVVVEKLEVFNMRLIWIFFVGEGSILICSSFGFVGFFGLSVDSFLLWWFGSFIFSFFLCPYFTSKCQCYFWFMYISFSVKFTHYLSLFWWFDRVVKHWTFLFQIASIMCQSSKQNPATSPPL